MRREILILLCSMLLGLGVAGCMAGIPLEQQERQLAWWSLLYDRPNAEQLPVQVDFLWAKNLNSFR